MKSEIEKKLNELAQKAFESHSFNFEPLFPNLLVRIFNFEEATSGLIIKPQVAQSPNMKAIVIKTWKPFKVNFKGQEFEVSSELVPGDIVSVPYYTGVELGIESLNDAGYRVISEGLDRDKNTGRVISYAAGKDRLAVFCKCGMYDMRFAAADIAERSGLPNFTNLKETIDDILKDYDIVPKRLSLAQAQGKVASTTT